MSTSTTSTSTTSTTGTTPTAAVPAVVGVAAGTRSERAAEHLGLDLVAALADRGVAVDWLTTHRTTGDDGPRLAVTLARATGDGDTGSRNSGSRNSGSRNSDGDDFSRAVGTALRAVPDGEDGDVGIAGARADQAAEAWRHRAEGRVVVFPGSAGVGARIEVGALLADTAIDEVVGLGGTVVSPADVVETRHFLRPRFASGRLVLHVQPARGGVLVPFETPSPTPCCADHA